MCGIVGLLNFNSKPIDETLLNAMTDSLSHRGPDGRGLYIDHNLGLGHRRLAILDLSEAGHQPMLTKCEQYAISYNGEIYNFKELRKELESLGHHFYSQTDTEVILKAYIEWRDACVDKFNGMFAFAVWDKARRNLFLARDRYGIKPLYYYQAGDAFIFASEQRAILLHPRVRREVDHTGLLEYFTFQNFFTESTLTKGVKMFPAGSYANVHLTQSGASFNVKEYWDFDFRQPEIVLSEQEYEEELARLFQQAVKRQMVSDVEVGAYLSGGIDSGGITAIASKCVPGLKSFTCGFDLSSASGMELTFDERKRAEHMSYLFKTEQYEMVLKAGDMERAFPSLARHIEEPRVGQCYPNYYMAKLASKFVKVVLSGAGGDEIFAGYPWRYYRVAHQGKFDDYIDSYYKFWQRLVPNSLIKPLFAPVADSIGHVSTRDIFKAVFIYCKTLKIN